MAEGLGDVIIGSQLQAFYLVHFITPYGEDDNRHIGGGTDFLQHVEAVHIRETKVEDNDIRGLGLKQF